MKRCRGCGELKSLDDFYRSNGNPVSYCKPCYRQRYTIPRAERRRQARREGRALNSRANRNRAFGVELEITGPSYDIILDALRRAGINVNHVGAYRATNGDRWELKRDCSVRGHGLELVSPKLSGPEGFEQLRAVCNALNSVNATVDRSCGLHVHHDMRGLNIDVARRIIVSFVERQDVIFQMMAPSRRNNNFCARWDSHYVSSLMRATSLAEFGRIGPRGAVNLHSYPRHGSMELRCHAGTTQYAKIAAWVRFGQALIKAAVQDERVAGDTVANTLSDLTRFGLTADDVRTLSRFLGTDSVERADVERRIAELQSVLEEV